MPALHTLYLGLAALGIAVATLRGRVHPFLATLLAAAGFALAAGMSISQFGKTFGTGFGQALNGLGLPVLAAAMLCAMADREGATAQLARLAAGRWARTRMALLTLLGLAAGTAASPGAAFAVLAPLRLPLSGADRQRSVLTLGLALSAGQALLLPAPALIAATAILGADWHRVLAVGLPVALLTALGGAVFAHLVTHAPVAPPQAPVVGGAARATAALIAACLVMLLLLIVQSIGDIPSEPLGGGSTRELIIGVGRPAILLLAGTGIMAVATTTWRDGGFSETGWTALAIARAAPLALLLGAAGGLQSLAQTAHMAELLAERVLPLAAGIAVPFLAAAIMKTIQGNTLVAAITAAGMVQPLLTTLGLDAAPARAIAVLAIGAGAATASHVNDLLFWLIADAAGLRPAAALRTVTLGTLLQGALALSALSLAVP